MAEWVLDQDAVSHQWEFNFDIFYPVSNFYWRAATFVENLASEAKWWVMMCIEKESWKRDFSTFIIFAQMHFCWMNIFPKLKRRFIRTNCSFINAGAVKYYCRCIAPLLEEFAQSCSLMNWCAPLPQLFQLQLSVLFQDLL